MYPFAAYNNANHVFRNLDSLIHHLNSHPVYGCVD